MTRHVEIDVMGGKRCRTAMTRLKLLPTLAAMHPAFHIVVFNVVRCCDVNMLAACAYVYA